MVIPPIPPLTSPLIGRDREQATLRAALDAALTGRGSLVLIGGEAGIGKTTLAEALCAAASAQGALVLVGRCYDLGEAPPYGPWTEALAHLPGAELLPAPLGAGASAGSQAVLFAHLRDALSDAARRRPTVLLLEDLHWADPGSLDLLRFIGRHLGALPLLLLTTHRDDELVEEHPLAATLPALVREARAARLAPSRLTAEHARELARSRYRLPPADEDSLAAHLHAHAEGNPFYLGELLRSLEEEGVLHTAGGDAAWALGDLVGVRVPPLLRQVIGARVARLGEDAGRLLAVASVIGQEVPLDLWAAVDEVENEALAGVVGRAVAARVLAETTDGQGVRFIHALVREALYEAIPLPRRRALHRHAADALLATPRPDPDAVASHLQRAGDPRAAEWLVRAGERAWRSYAWLTAAERYEDALALTAQGGMNTRERVLTLLMVAQLWRYADQHRGIAHLEQAERLALTAGEGALAAAARFDRGHLRLLGDNAQTNAEREAGLAAMVAALPVLEALPPAERARLPALLLQGVGGDELYHRGALLYWLAWVGRLHEVLALAAPIGVRGSGRGARGLAGLGLAYFHLGRPADAERTLADAQALFQAAGQQVEVHYRLIDRLRVALVYHLDDPSRWQQFPAAMGNAVHRASSAGYTEGDSTLLELLLIRGEWPEVRRRSGTTADESWVHASIARHQGDTAAAWARIERYLPYGPATRPGSHSLSHTMLLQQLAAALALDAGDLATAHSWLSAHDHWLVWSGSVWGRAEAHVRWAQYHRAAGDLPAAHERAKEALAHATTPRQPLALLAAHRLLGELATAATDHAAASAHLEAALVLADACAAPYERALTLLALAELRAALGDATGARAASAAARALLLPLEARPALARADSLAASLTNAPTARGGAAAFDSPPPTAPPAGLTVREAEVLRLVAAGRSNREMAEELCRSERTIERHLENIYRKIAARNRADATAFALRHRLA